MSTTNTDIEAITIGVIEYLKPIFPTLKIYHAPAILEDNISGIDITSYPEEDQANIYHMVSIYFDYNEITMSISRRTGLTTYMLSYGDPQLLERIVVIIKKMFP